MLGFLRRRGPTLMDGYGPVRTGQLPYGHRQEDLREFIPTSQRLRAWPGIQRKNGVGQISVFYNTPSPHNIPYWQMQQVVAQGRAVRVGASQSYPIPRQAIDTMRAATYAGLPSSTPGLGYVPPMAVPSHPYGIQ